MDVGSSRSAANVVGLVTGALKSLIIELGVVLEGRFQASICAGSCINKAHKSSQKRERCRAAKPAPDKHCALPPAAMPAGYYSRIAASTPESELLQHLVHSVRQLLVH